ncbi:MAG: hypothetical protein OES29_08350 [Desulfuromonadales bacterium]|nr:hypothetical protein [Desulfuromonadales bacterium]
MEGSIDAMMQSYVEQVAKELKKKVLSDPLLGNKSLGWQARGGFTNMVLS